MKWTDDRHSAGTARVSQQSTSKVVVAFPMRLSTGTPDHDAPPEMSDAEIVQLVSVALEDAILALGERNWETSLRLRAYEARVGLREMMSALPPERARDPAVVKDYRQAIAAQNFTLDIALKLAASIRGFKRIKGRDIRTDLA